LPPPDANAAFSQSQVDAGFIWEPFVTRAVQGSIGRVLLDGEQLRDSCNFLTTTRRFATEHPDVLAAFVDALQVEEAWSRDHPRDMAELLAPSLMIDVPTLLEMHGKYTYGLLPITPAWIDKQQEVADLWLGLGFLPARARIASTPSSPGARSACVEGSNGSLRPSGTREHAFGEDRGLARCAPNPRVGAATRPRWSSARRGAWGLPGWS
jgi:ABC-type nitrate/sulfonate/bicarbonate transport system substrate-binding protein